MQFDAIINGLIENEEKDNLDMLIDFAQRVSSCHIWDGQLQNFKSEAEDIMSLLTKKGERKCNQTEKL